MATRATAAAKPRDSRPVAPRASKPLAVRPDVRERFLGVLKRAEKRAADEAAARTAEARANSTRDAARGWRGRQAPLVLNAARTAPRPRKK